MSNLTIAQARQLAGKTQLEMADLMEMSEATYIRYEKYRGIFRMDDAYRFAKITDTPISGIIFFDKRLQKSCN